jgi:hypothetical protein
VAPRLFLAAALAAGKLMKQNQGQFELAIEVFVRGHSAVRSRTHPYDVDRIGPVWVMRDALRKNARDYRKEEWVASGVEPANLSRIAKGHARGHYFLCDLLAEGMSDTELRDSTRRRRSRWWRNPAAAAARGSRRRSS